MRPDRHFFAPPASERYTFPPSARADRINGQFPS
jgi:hypothetical protein